MKVRIVLLRPAEPMNVGGVARAMKNCALDDLLLVAPRTEDWVTARRIAVHAQDLLASPRIAPTLAEAIADCEWVVGTTSRVLPGRASLTPREVATRAASIAERVAVVFGGEESGLSNEDLLRCHDVSTIPSGLEQPSFNLAQAVLVYGYELFLGSHAPQEAKPVERAKEEELGHIERAMRELLGASGFANLDRPRHGVLDLLQPLRRAGLTPEEGRLWHAALRTILKSVRPKP